MRPFQKNLAVHLISDCQSGIDVAKFLIILHYSPLSVGVRAVN